MEVDKSKSDNNKAAKLGKNAALSKNMFCSWRELLIK